jgi:hypothetical protein
VRLSPGLRQPVKRLIPFDGKSFPFPGQSFNLMKLVKRRRATLASAPSRNSRPELIADDGQGVFFPACPIPWQRPDRKRDAPQG